MSLITFHGEEQYLYKSSLFFLIPTTYGLLTANTGIASLNLLSTLISFAFWYKPSYGFRRLLDKTYQPLFFLTMKYIGISNLNKQNWYLGVIGYSFSIIGLYLYHYASIQYYKPNRFWFIYHNAFHLFSALASLTVYATINNNKLIPK